MTKIEIKKLDYSSNPWRLLIDDGEVYHPQQMDHPDLGKTSVMMPLCGNTKAEVTQAALQLLLLQRDAIRRMMDEITELRKPPIIANAFACERQEPQP